MGQVTFTYDSYEDAEEIKLHHKASDMHSALHEIYHLIRDARKYQEIELSNDVDKLLDRIIEETLVISDIHC